MIKLDAFSGLSKGDLVKEIETREEMKFSGGCALSMFKTYNQVFVVQRVNKKTITCKYVDGYLSGAEFKLYKDFEINKYKKLYYLIEGEK